eukprot:TRINITY_DN2013_c0_g1_i2.p1 TRINITY_DN2013_c0_g1~~TRINITY_DN2013_c0_g1_i2.p1  ORF type:complete len:334 (+),score=57.15 TRINITY_DN2013_c0_g1_i2:152-1153(+)
MATTDVAIKRMRKQTDPQQQQGDREFIQEISIAAACRHPSILPLFGFSIERSERCLVYPLMIGGSLEDRISKPVARFEWNQRLKVATQVAEAIEFLHRTDDNERSVVLHRDIKPSNILLDEFGNAKLADVGSAKFERPTGSNTITTTSAMVLSLGYTDPQYLASGSYEPASDVYSFGVVLLRLWTGKPALEGTQLLATYCKMSMQQSPDELMHSDLSAWRGVPQEALSSFVKIALECVSSETFQRPTSSVVRQRLQAVVDKFCASRADASLEMGDRCCYCMAREVECQLQPCGHSIACMDCAEMLLYGKQAGNNRCPICKKQVQELSDLESNI